MVTSTQDAIAYYLQTGGYGTVGTDIFVDFSVPSPSNLIIVTGYSGAAPDRGIGQKAALLQSPMVQVMVRNENSSTALTNINAIQAYLEGCSGITSNGSYLIQIIATSSGANYCGKDDNNLTLYSTNFEVLV